MPAPSPAVPAAFGARGPAEPLAGGRGIAWRAGDVVLKPLDMPMQALWWQAEVLGGIVCDGFRVAAPLRSARGELVVDGWTAWPFLDGTHAPRWREIVEAGERFHGALTRVERPALLDARTDPWARADRVAWGEAHAGDLPALPEVASLLALRSDVSAPSQLVHGDLSGNVLFADDLPPAIIDLSPYWRPVEYASAIVAVDAVLWHGADLELLSATAARQLLVRALLFRVLASADRAAEARRARPAIERVAELSG
jgi:uncharacterized protein (TIGR02569 family)